MGMNAATGRRLSGRAHLHQSITDILTTPIGSRVMRRAYGSRLPHLIDAPANPATDTALIAATVEAINRWDPRIRVNQVDVDHRPGAATLSVIGTDVQTGETIRLDGISISL